jgi:glycosyltransferase involved in cell wall biosynthesis
VEPPFLEASPRLQVGRQTLRPPAGAPVHILFLIDQLCQPGGAERALLNALRLLPKERFHCSVATFRLDTRVALFRDLSCPVYHFPLRRTYDANALATAVRLRRLIRDQHISIVHSFFETSDLWGGLVAKLSGCPVLISSRRDMGIFRARKHEWAYRAMGPLFDRVLTVSEEVRRFCIEHDGLDPSKVVTVYNGIDLKKVEEGDGRGELQRLLRLSPGARLVVTVGHVRRVKGFDILIRAAATVCQRLPRTTFVVAGEPLEPDYVLELEDLARSLGVAERVCLLGGTENVFPLLRTSDVFCLPSRSEGFSNALLEAMACGLPCVVTRVGGNAEAVKDGHNGFLVPPEDPLALAERLLVLLENSARAKRMGEAGARIVRERFTVEAMIDQLVGIYDDLLEARRH